VKLPEHGHRPAQVRSLLRRVEEAMEEQEAPPADEVADAVEEVVDWLLASSGSEEARLLYVMLSGCYPPPGPRVDPVDYPPIAPLVRLYPDGRVERFPESE
jgi:cobalamin biosynthesis Mg chelatase CobN